MNPLTPYTGNEKYIFISYSHRDTDQVFPVIAELISKGYRVWYDQGIDPGTEWDENIASHIQECGYFLAFISNNYLNSNNCKDELNYARDLEKERLIVYLEEVVLPSGIAMRVNRLQSIYKYTYGNNEKAFYDKLFSANNIGCCLEKTESDEASLSESVKEEPASVKTEPNPEAKPEATVFQTFDPAKVSGAKKVKFANPNPETPKAAVFQTFDPAKVSGAKKAKPANSNSKISKTTVFFWGAMVLFLVGLFIPLGFLGITASLIFQILCIKDLTQKWMRICTLVVFCISLVVLFIQFLASLGLPGFFLFGAGCAVAIVFFVKRIRFYSNTKANLNK